MTNQKTNKEQEWEKDYLILNSGCLIRKDRIKEGVIQGDEETRKSLKEIISARIKKAREEGFENSKVWEKFGREGIIQQARAEALKEVLPKEQIIEGEEERICGMGAGKQGFNSCRQEIINKALQKWGIKL